MTREQLEHVLRAASAITDERDFVVLGSQAVLGQYPAAPGPMLESNEVDIYPLQRPDLSTLIDGSIGRDSPFHLTFGYYADGVGPETATLPKNWRARAVTIATAAMRGATAICPEIHDLAVAKLVAGREKDLAWVAAGLAAGLVSLETLARCADELETAPDALALVRRRIAALS